MSDLRNSTLVNELYDWNIGFFTYNDINEKLYFTKDNKFFIVRKNSNIYFLDFDSDEEIIYLSYEDAYKYIELNCPDKLSYYFNFNCKDYLEY